MLENPVRIVNKGQNISAQKYLGFSEILAYNISVRGGFSSNLILTTKNRLNRPLSSSEIKEVKFKGPGIRMILNSLTTILDVRRQGTNACKIVTTNDPQPRIQYLARWPIEGKCRIIIFCNTHILKHLPSMPFL